MYHLGHIGFQKDN